MKRCSCPWVATIDHGWVNGSRLRPSRRAHTKAAALAALDDLRLAKTRGIVPTSATLDEWLTYWLAHVVGPSDLKPSTKTAYTSACDQWLRPLVGKVRLDKLGPEHVRGLHQAMRRAGKSPTTIRNAHAALRRALGAALSDRRVSINWAREVPAPNAADRPHPVLSVEDAGNVFVVASRNPRELARVHVAVLCGLRQGEALALRWEDVGEASLRVEWSAARVDGVRVRQRPKTARSRRTVPLPPAARESLAAWRRASGGRGFVFHGHPGPDSIEGSERDYRAWRKILDAADVPAVPLHGARGTCATILLRQGVPERVIADILGQSDVRVLMEHYLHSTDADRREALESLGEVFELEPAQPLEA